MIKMAHSCYHYFSVPKPNNESWVLQHFTDEHGFTCWCEPDVLVNCPFCDSETGPEPDMTNPIVCEYCGNFGLLDTDFLEWADIPEDEPLLVVHRDV